MDNLKKLLFGAALSAPCLLSAQTLVAGGQFKDRIQPMQGCVTLETMRAENPSAKIWGAPGVQNRFVDNGVEADNMNIWGGNVYRDGNGVYHQFVAGWDGETRAFSYWSNSHIYHFTSTTPYGPFSNPIDIGRGHNPEIFQAKDGTFVVYSLIGNKACYRLTAATLDGPWTFEPMPYDLRDRAMSTGSTTTFSNWTFARRPDGSQYCMDRGGAVWVSKDGLSDFVQVYGTSCYPNGGGGTFEDPVVWKDEFQYHMIVNDWKAQKAYYSRSADGFHWVAEDGLGYDTEVSVHPDGTREQWYKYERPRVFQDEHGRAIQLNMAVIDTIKAQDLANDNHSSKNIAMPLNPGLLLEVLNDTPISTSTAEIRVKVMKEEGFDPATQLDLESLRFGAYSTVNTGGGAPVAKSEQDADGNLILTFNGADTGIAADEFAPKLLGRYVDGYEMNTLAGKQLKPSFCYGYAKLPYYNYNTPYLSPVLPEIGEGSVVTKVKVENFGLTSSDEGKTVKVLTSGGVILATGTVKALEPYASDEVSLTPVKAIPSGQTTLFVAFYDGNTKTDSHKLQLDSINAKQAKLSSAYNEAKQLYDNDQFKNGREAMKTVLDETQSALSSYYEPEILAAAERLEKASADFKEANPDVANVTCRNYYLKTANYTSGYIYMSVDASGSIVRKKNADDACVFTLVNDADHGRVYLYNVSQKCFVVPKVGNSNSFWSTSTANAYALAQVEASTTTANAYTIKGVQNSTNTYNYLNAYGGQNHTEVSSYTQADKGSQWLLVATANQQYAFDLTGVEEGKDEFVESVSPVPGVTITPVVTAISDKVLTEERPLRGQRYNLCGMPVDDNYNGLVIIKDKKTFAKP